MDVLFWEGVIEKKGYESTLKTFLSLLKKSHVYSFLLVAFFVNISTPSRFKDERTIINF